MLCIDALDAEDGFPERHHPLEVNRPLFDPCIEDGRELGVLLNAAVKAVYECADAFIVKLGVSFVLRCCVHRFSPARVSLHSMRCWRTAFNHESKLRERWFLLCRRLKLTEDSSVGDRESIGRRGCPTVVIALSSRATNPLADIGGDYRSAVRRTDHVHVEAVSQIDAALRVKRDLATAHNIGDGAAPKQLASVLQDIF